MQDVTNSTERPATFFKILCRASDLLTFGIGAYMSMHSQRSIFEREETALVDQEPESS